MLHINYIHKHTRSLIHISQRVKFVLSLRAVILLIAAPRLSFNIKIVFAGSVADGVYSRVCGCVFFFSKTLLVRTGARLSEEQLTSKVIAITI